MVSFKSSANIQKKECGSDRSVSNHLFSTVILHEMAKKVSVQIAISSFKWAVDSKTDINLKGVQIVNICLEYKSQPSRSPWTNWICFILFITDSSRKLHILDIYILRTNI